MLLLLILIIIFFPMLKRNSVSGFDNPYTNNWCNKIGPLPDYLPPSYKATFYTACGEGKSLPCIPNNLRLQFITDLNNMIKVSGVNPTDISDIIALADDRCHS